MIPNIIYLRIINGLGEEIDPTEEETTWCIHRMNNSDIKYVREEKHV